MESKSYKPVWYHIVFSTGNRVSLITESVREDLYHFIRNKCRHNGLNLHSLGGTGNHVHMLVAIPPETDLTEFISQMKGASAFYVNRNLSGDDLLHWQQGYSVLTVAETDIPAIREYILRQQELHAENTTIPEFENSIMDGE